MGVEYMLVDHERREYFDLGKNFAYDAFVPDGKRMTCYGHQLRCPMNAAELESRLRADLIRYDAEGFEADGYWTRHLPEIAEHIFSFLQERAGVVCVHDDSSWDQENYVEVGTRYHDDKSSCEGCRNGLPMVDNEKHDPLTHEHFKAVLTAQLCATCSKLYSEHPLALEYPLDTWELEDTGDVKAFGPFLRRLCNRELVKWDVLPEPDPSCESKFAASLPPPTERRYRSALGFGPRDIAPGATVEVVSADIKNLFRPDRFHSLPESAEVESFAYETLQPGNKRTLRVKNPTDKPIKWTGTLFGIELMKKEK